MSRKKLRELTYNDLGKQVAYDESDGNRNSGELTTVLFSASSLITIGNAQIMIPASDMDREITFTD